MVFIGFGVSLYTFIKNVGLVIISLGKEWYILYFCDSVKINLSPMKDNYKTKINHNLVELNLMYLSQGCNTYKTLTKRLKVDHGCHFIELLASFQLIYKDNCIQNTDDLQLNICQHL